MAMKSGLGGLISRIGAWYRPGNLPLMARGHYVREMRAWALLALTLGGIEGGVAGVLVKTGFAGVVAAPLLNQAVAVVAGAPAFANIMSFWWAQFAAGRDKIRFMAALQALCAGCVAVVALAPRSVAGLILLCAAAVTGRTLWSGIITIRSTVWRANYPRHTRANMTARLVTVTALLMAGTGAAIGWAVESGDVLYRGLYLACALAGLAGAWQYRGMRVRRERALRAAERAGAGNRPRAVSPGGIVRILKRDRLFRRYMAWMFLFGSGNLMVMAPLIVILNEKLDLPALHQMLITASVPLMTIPLTIPLWARLLDRQHVVRFRARQSWFFVLAILAYWLGAATGLHALLWIGAVLQGTALAGGMLGWNLGHHDFAPAGEASRYMGVHVTLTGLRGLLMPFLGVNLYLLAEHLHPGSGPWILGLPFLMSLCGALGFLHMNHRLSAADARTT